jgi:transcriptional regulator with XRE-family HTH domain
MIGGVIDAATTIRSARVRAGLSQAGLARRAGTSQPALCLYESGARQPTTATFDRLLRAAGAEAVVIVVPRPPDTEEHGRVLAELLDLADQLPQRHARRLPRLGFAALR